MRAFPYAEEAEDAWRIAMDFGEAAIDRARVEIGGIDFIGIEFGRKRKAHIKQALPLDRKVRDEIAAMVEAFFTRPIHVAIDGGRVVMLFDELDHHLAQIAEGIGDIGLLIGAAIGERVAAMVPRHEEGPGPINLRPFARRVIDAADEPGLLKHHALNGHHPPPSVRTGDRQRATMCRGSGLGNLARQARPTPRQSHPQKVRDRPIDKYAHATILFAADSPTVRPSRRTRIERSALAATGAFRLRERDGFSPADFAAAAAAWERYGYGKVNHDSLVRATRGHMIMTEAKGVHREPPPLIPPIAAIPAIFALSTMPQLSSIFPATDFIRFYSLPVTTIQIMVILLAMMRGIRLFEPICAERLWVKLALITLCLVALGTAQFVAIDKFSAYLRTFAWGVHLLFGLAVAGLARRYWAERMQEIWWWLLGGLLVYMLILIAYVATMTDPQHYPWKQFGVSVINVRQLGFFSAAGFSIAIAIAFMAENKRSRWIAVAAAAVMIALSFWSGTRSSVLSSIAALVAAGIICREARSLRAAGLVVAAFGLGAGLSMVYVAPDPEMGFMRLFKDTEREGHYEMSSGRFKIWASTAHNIAKRPLFGYGESQFRLAEPTAEMVINHPHNSVLQFLFQWGFVGAGCFFALVTLLTTRLTHAATGDLEVGLPGYLVGVNTLSMSLLEGSLYHPFPIAMAVLCCAATLAALPRQSVV